MTAIEWAAPSLSKDYQIDDSLLIFEIYFFFPLMAAPNLQVSAQAPPAAPVKDKVLLRADNDMFESSSEEEGAVIDGQQVSLLSSSAGPFRSPASALSDSALPPLASTASGSGSVPLTPQSPQAPSIGAAAQPRVKEVFDDPCAKSNRRRRARAPRRSRAHVLEIAGESLSVKAYIILLAARLFLAWRAQLSAWRSVAGGSRATSFSPTVKSTSTRSLRPNPIFI